MSQELVAQLALLPDYLGRHLVLCITALTIGIGVSLPLAFLAERAAGLRAVLLTLASIVQTIPGLALLALMVPLLGRIGFLPAVIALVLYSVLPVLRNTLTGLRDVDPNLLEAGTGLGMTPNQLLLKVQLPLALPVIVAGVRTATVWVVGLATLSTPVGATSLGNYIFSGLQTQNYVAVLVGCTAAALLAVLLDRLIRVVEIAIERRDKPMLAGAALATLAALAAGVSPLLLAAGGTGSLAVIGTKTFTEQYVLGRVLAERLEAAGLRTRTLDSLGSTVAFDALVAGRIDLYVDYTGTIWANYMHRTTNPGREPMLREVREWLAREHDIELLLPLGFENAYAIAMPRTRAESLGVRTMADLAAIAPNLALGGDYEFFSRPEWRDLAAAYDLTFRELVTMDSTLMYSAAAAGEVDAIAAFSTDGRISAFDLVVLDDPRDALPPYDAVVLLGANSAQRLPGIRAALAPLAGAIDDDAMRAANRLVDLDGGSVQDAAALLARSVAAAAPRP